MYSPVPVDNYSGGDVNANSNGLPRYFTVSSTTDGSSTSPVARNSFTQPLTASNGSFGDINVYDFTMNSASQTITRANTSTWTIDGNLNVNNGTISSGTTTSDLTVTGNVTVGSGTTLSLSTASGADLFIGGNFTNNGTFTCNERVVAFNGTTAQTLNGSAATTIDFMIMNNAAGLTLSRALIVDNDLTLTAGRITLGEHELTQNSTGSILGTPSSSNYIVTNGTAGKFTQSNFTGSKSFPVGTASTYAPATVNNTVAARDFSVKVGTTFSGTPVAPTKMVQLEWNVTPSVGTGNNANLTFEWPLGSEGGAFFRANPTEIAHFNGSIWDSYKLATIAGAGPYTATASGFTTFSPFTVANQNALSAELTDINVKVKGNTSLLSWQTASEKDNALFQIERASNATDFSPIGEVKGSGNSAAAKNYTFTDVAPLSGVNYYRLKAVDYNGAATLSKVVSVNFSGKNDTKIAVYPNPTRDVLRVDVNATEASTTLVQVSDLMGRVVLSQSVTVNKGANLLPFNVSSLPSGAYFVKVNGDVTRFVKQ